MVFYRMLPAAQRTSPASFQLFFSQGALRHLKQSISLKAEPGHLPPLAGSSSTAHRYALGPYQALWDCRSVLAECEGESMEAHYIFLELRSFPQVLFL